MLNWSLNNNNNNNNNSNYKLLISSKNDSCVVAKVSNLLKDIFLFFLNKLYSTKSLKIKHD